MKRDYMVEEMIKFYKSIPQEASDYHRFDTLLSHMQHLGMLPPLIREVIYTPQYEGDDDTWIGGQDDYTIVSVLQWGPED